MNNNPTINPEFVPNPFKYFCMTIGYIPTSYKNSLDYYEQLLWLIKFLENTVIPAVDNNALAVTELQNLYIQLKDYVEHYFKNLDVQQMINDKLDEMASDGTLENLLNNYANLIKVYSTTIEMLIDETIVKGQTIKTLGYYELNDNGGAVFTIDDEINENLIQLSLENGLYANIVVNDTLALKQIGCKNETEEFDNTALIQKAINYCVANNVEMIVDDKYLTDGLIVENTIKITGVKLRNKCGFKLIANANEDYLLKLNDEGIEKTIIKDIYLDGNKTNNSNVIDGLYIYSSFYRDFYLLVENCNIQNFTGNGVYIGGAIENRTVRECRFYNDDICYNEKHGILAESMTDSQFFGCTLHNNTLAGLYLNRTGSIRITNCKAFWNGNAYDDLESIDRIPASAYSVTSDEIYITGKTYYTRTGKGTWQYPYKFTLFTGTSFEPDTDYYERSGVYYKKYAGFMLLNANDTLISNCDLQDNSGDGIALLSVADNNVIRNIMITNTKLDNNGLLRNDNTPISYASQGLKQLYSGIYCDRCNYLTIDIETNNFRQGSVGYCQASGIDLYKCDNTFLKLNARLQPTNMILKEPVTYKRMNLNVNGSKYVFNFDLSDITLAENFSIIKDGWNDSFIKVVDNILYYNLILKNSQANISSDGTLNILATLPSQLRPSSIINCNNAILSNNNYNRRVNTYISYIDPQGKLQVANNESGNNTIIITGSYILN